MRKTALTLAMMSLPLHANVLVTEVLYDSPADDQRSEWIELSNTGCETVSLDGWSIRDNASTFALNGQIGANQTLVLARNSYGFEELHGFRPDVSNLSLSLGNSGDYLELRDRTKTVDVVAWENKLSGWSINARDRSIYRVSAQDTDSVNDWKVSNGVGNPGQFAFAGCDDIGNGDNSGSGGNGDNGGNSGSGQLPTDISKYYQDAVGKTGAELKAALATISAKGHTRLSYSQVWDALEYTDQDPNNSNNVILLYTGRSQVKTLRAGLSNSQDAWNREHVWAKSLGFPSSGQWAYTDIHHLRPTDVSVNSARSNKNFANGGSQIGEAPGNYTDHDSFEPRNEVKGDVARSLFYMATRYQGMDGNTPDLELVRGVSSSKGNPTIGDVCTLLDWSVQDPIDEWERSRHERIVERQGNRNPYIDHPEWAEEVYRSDCN